MNHTPNRILIVGDAGRGKTTLALRLSEKLGLPANSTDDIFWKKKFTVKENAATGALKAQALYSGERWIVEGTTASLWEAGLPLAEVIVHLRFRSLIEQWYVILKRAWRRKNEAVYQESLLSVMLLLRHVTYKRYGLGYKKNDLTTEQDLLPYADKVIELHDHSEIEAFLDRYTIE